MKGFLSNMFRKAVGGLRNKANDIVGAKHDQASKELNKKIRKRIWLLSRPWIFWPALIFFVVVLLLTIISSVQLTGRQTSINNNTQVCATGGASDAGADGDTSGVGGDWTKEGTKAYKNAQEIFNFWVQKHHFTTAAAAGVVGNVYVESASSFAPDVGQGSTNSSGGFHSMLKEGPTSGTGGGLYQFTPYTKYAPLGDDKWKSVQKENEFVWNSELKNYHADLESETDVSKATANWQRKYERPANPNDIQPNRIAAAKKAYTMFADKSGGSNDSSSSDDSVINQGSDNSSTSDLSSANACGQSTDTASGERGKIFDSKQNGITLNAGLDDPNHMGIGTGSGVHGPGSHDGWDIDPLATPSGAGDPAIYSVTDGKIKEIGRGTSGGLLFILIQAPDGSYVQYQEFGYNSIPSNLQKGQSIKAGTKIGTIGDAGASGGIHSGRYLHITYADKDTPVNAGAGIASWGATKHTKSPGELFGITADKWVHASKQYKWSDMKLTKSDSK